MTRIIARFDVELPGELLIAWPDGDEIVFKQDIDGFEVEIQFDTDWAASRKFPEDQNTNYGFRNTKIYVSREEVEAPPIIKIDKSGGRDFSEVNAYIEERRKEYGEVAGEVTNRMIRFFKYVLRIPNLIEISKGHVCFQNATWTDDLGNDYGHGGTTFGTVSSPAWEGLGRQKLVSELEDSFLAALGDPIVPSLHEEILSDAQTALNEGSIRRAVLEMAIACEIAVKRKYFSEESAAGSAFDYLEDRSLIRVRVLDLIDGIAQEAFGKSFREEQSEHYWNIEYLFRCRNKVAHRGELTYRDKNKKRKVADSATVSSWWDSVLTLIDWIDDL